MLAVVVGQPMEGHRHQVELVVVVVVAAALVVVLLELSLEEVQRYLVVEVAVLEMIMVQQVVLALLFSNGHN
jgi:hypothetical protein